MKKFLPLAVTVVLGIFAGNVFSQSAVGYDFLRTSVGARASAMGGSFVAIPGDIHALFYNPAGLSGLNERQGTFSYLNHILDFQSGFLGYAHPLASGTAGLALNFYDFGQFDGRDQNNEPTGEFSANGLVLSAGFSREVMKNVSLGGNAKYIRFSIDDFTQTAGAVDAGVLVAFPSQNLHVGVAVLNLGSTTSAFINTEDDLPTSVQFGAAKVLEHLPVMVSGQVVKFRDDGLDFRLGGEITVTEQLQIRLGYDSVGQDQKVDSDKDRLAGVSFGLGFKVNKFNIDYSLSSFGEVGSLNRFTLVGRF